MEASDKKELENELVKLQREKEELINDIRDLDWAKIIKLEKENEELQKKVEWLDKDKKKTDREKENLFRQVSNSRRRMWLNSLKMIAVIGITRSSGNTINSNPPWSIFTVDIFRNRNCNLLWNTAPCKLHVRNISLQLWRN